MSEFNVTVPGGESLRLKTGGKYCPADILVTANMNLFDIDSIKLSSPDRYGLDYKPYVENGVFYSGGISGVSAGCYAYVDVNPGDAIAFFANMNGNDGYVEVRGFSAPADNGVTSGKNTKILQKAVANSNHVATAWVVPEGFSCIGFAAYSPTQYGIQLTNITIAKCGVGYEEG